MNTVYDLIGVGIGPSNLSLAALLHPLGRVNSVFFDKKYKFVWHEGMLLPGAALQVHYLKDLVSLIDPTNRFSFVAYLSANKRLHQFINAHFTNVTRLEFNNYYQWVAESLRNLRFGYHVHEMQVQNRKLAIYANNDKFVTKNVVMGCGLNKSIPACAEKKLCDSVIHSGDFLSLKNKIKNKNIVIIGGGQSGAEILLNILSKEERPQSVSWVSRRDNFLPMDDSPFTNELFTPTYSDRFYNFPLEKRRELVSQQKLFSDGISLSTLQLLYQKMYELKYIEKNPLCYLMPSFELINLTKNTTSWVVSVKNLETGSDINLQADLVILCTGYRYELPPFLQSIEHYLNKDNDGNLIINKDYSLSWNGPEECRLYLQNGALLSRGVADPNLSLLARRSSIIINSLLEEKIYETQDDGIFGWEVKEINKESIYA